MRTRAIVILFVVAAISVLVGSAKRQPADHGTTVGRIGERIISLEELDRAWQQSDPAGYNRANQAVYDGRRDALDRLISDAVIARAAAAKGVSAGQFTGDEIQRRTIPVTGADVESFYRENPDQVEGSSLETMRDSIRRYLEQQRPIEARRSLLADLRKAGPPVEATLTPLRHAIQISGDDPHLGSTDAPITMIEFSDYQCPFCKSVAPTLRRLLDKYGDRIRLVWKDSPITSIHPQAMKAAEAAHCAGEQGKYWPYHDLLFRNQAALDPVMLKQYAKALGLDASAFNRCLDEGRYAERVNQSLNAGLAIGIDSTPTVFINGRMIAGAESFEKFAAIIDDELQHSQEPADRPVARR